MDKGPFLFRRLGRALLWPNPGIYRWVGRLRGRGDCFAEDFDLWIEGFPRSANTFTEEAFQMANPSARVKSHRHIPTFIIQWTAMGKPGIFLIRKPEDAVISWAIFWQTKVEDCLDYYIDFHRVLRPHAAKLFTVTFEAVTADFGKVIAEFNKRFGTRYASISHGEETVAECFARIEKTKSFRDADGTVDELRVCRPSPQRSQLKPELQKQLRELPRLRRKLDQARELYEAFAPTAVRMKPQTVKKPGNTQALPMVS